jgi:hypothetical protein
MKIVRLDGQPAEQFAAISQVFRDQVVNIAFGLPHTIDRKQRSAKRLSSIPFE